MFSNPLTHPPPPAQTQLPLAEQGLKAKLRLCPALAISLLPLPQCQSSPSQSAPLHLEDTYIDVPETPEIHQRALYSPINSVHGKIK